MIEIGGRPILWHIMKIYSATRNQRLRRLPRLQGLRHQGVFRELFPAHVGRHLRYGQQRRCRSISAMPSRGSVTLVDTGEDTHDRRAAEARQPAMSTTKSFCFTYGDGVADVDIAELVRVPPARGKMATLTAVRPLAASAHSRSQEARVRSFAEKPQRRRRMDQWRILRALSPRCLDYIDGDQTSWENEPLERLAARRRACGLSAHRILAADGHAARQEPSGGIVAVGTRSLESVDMTTRSDVPGTPYPRDRPYRIQGQLARLMADRDQRHI